MIIIVLVTLVTIMSIVYMYDLVYVFNTWQSRIKIGRWDDRYKWRDAVAKKARIWLKKTPLIPKSDGRRLILIDIIRHNYYSEAVQSWQVAGLIMGLDEAEARDYYRSKQLFSYLNDAEIDCYFLVYALRSKGINEDNLVSAIINQLSAINNQSLPYRNSLPDIRFIDTLGLACPLLYSLGMDEMADKQIKDFDNVLLSGVFPPHAVNLNGQLPLGVYDWGRGLGWYILCLIESDCHKNRIIQLAKQLLKYQRKDGSFGCFIFNSYSQRESSITAIAGLLFIKAYEINQDPLFIKAAIATERALMTMTRRNGEVDFAQGDTKGIGMYSSYFGIMPFVQGMSLYLSKSLDQFIN